MARALTVAALEKMKPDPTRRLEIPDGLLAGLYFIIQTSGARSWAIRYRAAGKPKKLTLGSYPAIDLSEARDQAKAALLRVQKGADPAAEKQAAKQAKAEDDAERDEFARVAARYLREYGARRRNYPEKIRLLGFRLVDGEFSPIKGKPADIWSRKLVQAITKRDVREYVEAYAREAPIGANRAFAELRKFFSWAVGKDIIASSPMTGMQPPTEENAPKSRVLIRRADVPGSSDAELRWLWDAAAAYDRNDPGEAKGGHGAKIRGPFGPFIQMLILTGQRRSEVSDMEWAEIDMQERTWTIPASRAKNGQAHLVPLSDAAVAVLEAMPRIRGSKFVFTTDGSSPISGFSRMKQRLDKLMAEFAKRDGAKAAIPGWTVHDIRRTVATGLQRLGVRLEVTELVLNHKSGSLAGIVSVYQTHDMYAEKRAALDAWAGFVAGLVDPAAVTDNVVPLRATA